MKKNVILFIIINTVIITSAFLFTNCYNDDTAIVTIRLERNDLASFKQEKPKPLIDRILGFFSTPAFAGSWQDVRTDLSYTVTASDMETIPLTPIPSGTTQFSIEVPAGLNRQFTVTAFYDVWGHNVWGGQTIASLTAGQESVINIKMIPMTNMTAYSSTGTVYLSWTAILSQYNFSRYIIYKSTNANGPYTELKRISLYSAQNDTDTNVISGTVYYYRIAIESDADGMGVMSDIASVTAM